MQTEDVKLEKLQVENQEVRKKLEKYRSGIEKMMSKQNKKTIKHQPPQNDTRSPKSNFGNQYFSNSSGGQESSPKMNDLSKQMQFGFNSTLFRQIGNDSVLIQNSSGMTAGYAGSNLAYNSVPNKQYFSTQSKQSGGAYSSKEGQNNGQSFKKSMQLFSQIDELMNKVNKTSKLPVKPIQKYFNKNQHKRNQSQLQQLEFETSKSATKFDQQQLFHAKNKTNNKVRTIQQVQGQIKGRNQNTKLELRNATTFLKNYKEKSDLLRTPPLPPPSQTWYPDRRIKAHEQQQQQQYKDQQVRERNQFQNSNKKGVKVTKRSPQINNSSQNSVQLHRNRIKQTLNQRKKIIKQEGILDDSIQLQLSEQQDQIQNPKQHQSATVDKAKQKRMCNLKKQKQLLLKELGEIQQQLEKLQDE